MAVPDTVPVAVGAVQSFVIGADRLRLLAEGMAAPEGQPQVSGKVVGMEFVGSTQTIFIESDSGRDFRLQRLDLDRAKRQIAAADQVIAGFISPMQSLAEIGGMDDLSGIRNLGEAYQQQQQYFLQLLQYGAALKKPQTFVSLRSPYEISLYGPYVERALATYAYHGWQNADGTWVSPVYQALAEVLLGQSKATGRLPVTLVEAPGA